mgnify:CR=1 FL=1
MDKIPALKRLENCRAYRATVAMTRHTTMAHSGERLGKSVVAVEDSPAPACPVATSTASRVSRGNSTSTTFTPIEVENAPMLAARCCRSTRIRGAREVDITSLTVS